MENVFRKQLPIETALTLAVVFVGLQLPAVAADSALAKKPVTQKQEANKPEAPKTDSVTKELGGTGATPTNDEGVPLKKQTAAEIKTNQNTVNAVNKIPNVNIEAKDLTPPAPEPEIKGFHPIKRAMQPVVRLGKTTVKLEQEIMKLSGPIGALQPSMNGLHKKLDVVDGRMTTVNENLSTMDGHVIKVGDQMNEVREDLGHMRKDLSGLREPLQSIQEPLNRVGQPLEEVRKQLAEMKTLLGSVLLAIVIATVGIAVGTPVAAILIFANRRKFFPKMQEAELRTGEKVGDSRIPAGHGIGR